MSLRSKCLHCRLEYENFSTNLSFKEVKNMLWVDDVDSARWRQKRRNSVLGFWHELKLSMWKEHLEMCGPVAEMEVEFVTEY